MELGHFFPGRFVAFLFPPEGASLISFFGKKKNLSPPGVPGGSFSFKKFNFPVFGLLFQQGLSPTRLETLPQKQFCFFSFCTLSLLMGGQGVFWGHPVFFLPCIRFIPVLVSLGWGFVPSYLSL